MSAEFCNHYCLLRGSLVSPLPKKRKKIEEPIHIIHMDNVEKLMMWLYFWILLPFCSGSKLTTLKL